MAYTYGNLAVREAERQHETKKTRNRPNPAPVRKTLKLSALEKLVYLVACFALMGMLGGLVLLNSQLYNANHHIYQTKNEMKEQDEKNAELKAMLWTVKNPEKLSSEAVAGGFKPVKEDQKPSQDDNSKSRETASR
ncbi:hypothetical protein [Gorillibacterium timonense]|uniref:hypothetical protein n=1 Tax=Gorillibacterium timonense TaxID=1689269 RepID=UPI0011DCC718|nr:hypothetical protein [Gorillibacterium timonense]